MNAFYRLLAAKGGATVLVVSSLATFDGRAASVESALPDFAARFANPPADSRIIKIIHGWPDQPEAQDGLIQRLHRQGFGGVVCNVAFDQYLESDAKWEAFTRAVREAKRAGMALWLYDERGYPSGNAGGLVLRDHPEWEARGLLAADTECGAGPVELTAPPGDLFLAAAFPVREKEIDLTGKVDLAAQVREGKLRWTAPEGRWHVMVLTESRLYEGTHAEGNLHQKMPYVNLLMPEPTQRFLDLTHQRYAAKLGGNLGRDFVATFTDEPSLMSCYLRPMPWRPLPWAPNLPVEFKRRRGYALDRSVVPALVASAGPRGARIRYDFWLTVGELVSANFFGQIQDRCRGYQIPSGGHLLMEEGMVAHVPLYGDFFRCARRLDAPSIDCLTSLPADVPWFIARLLASAAELEGRRIVMSETSDHAQVWRPAGDQRPKRVVSEAEIRGTCNRLIVSGVNAITSYYSFTDLSDEALRRLNEWIGRCCSSLAGGRQAADIALLYPVESIWPRFRPARLWAGDSPEASAIESTWRAAADSLFAAQRDFTVVDSRTLAEANVDDGALTQGGLAWRVLILPGADTLPAAAWENLERFAQSGGVIIALGALPRNSETEFPSLKAQVVGRKLFGESRSEPSVLAQNNGGAGVFLPAGSEGLLPVVLDGLLERDVEVHGPRSPVRATHRRIDGQEVYFLINDSPGTWQGEVSLSGTGAGERWDPAGRTVAQTNVGPKISLDLGPYGAAVFRYPAARIPERRAMRSGPLPNLEVRTVPVVDPAQAQGEFVRAEVVSDPVHSAPGHPAWKASARLTKSQVDTYMFLRLLYPEPLNLEGTDCLVLDVWVPDGQQTPSRLLAILQEKGGGDFLAETGAPLGVSGHHRVFVPLSRLQLAGWSKDSDGQLDLKRVSEVRIGWGGYFGKEGEQVEFSVALPQTGSTTKAARLSALGQGTGFLPGQRVLPDAHNCYPYEGMWMDRVDRALGAGLPIGIEMDLVWDTSRGSAAPRVVVRHGGKAKGTEPSLRDYFFEKARPHIEKALKEDDRSQWPLITLNLNDLRASEPEFFEAVWKLMGDYESWLCTAPKTTDPAQLAPLDLKPVLVLTSDGRNQARVFYEEVPLGGRLRMFAAGNPSRGADNFRRWLNYPWSKVEPEGQTRAGDWSAQDAARLKLLVEDAHRRGYWIRFYTLNGHGAAETALRGWTPSYNFGSLEAVTLRWRAAKVAGVDFVASDQYEDCAKVLRGD